MAIGKPVLTQEEDVWVIRVEAENGKTQEFRCASQRQAQQLMLVLAPREPARSSAPPR